MSVYTLRGPRLVVTAERQAASLVDRGLDVKVRDVTGRSTMDEFATTCWELTFDCTPGHEWMNQPFRATYLKGLNEGWVEALRLFTRRLGAKLAYPDDAYSLEYLRHLTIRAAMATPEWAHDFSLPVNGNLAANATVFVGEKLAKRAVTPWAFNLPRDSSKWLADCFHGLKDDQLPTLVNSWHPEGQITKGEEALRLVLGDPFHQNQRRVVALGNSAAENLMLRGYHVDVVLCHPSWAKRFRSSDHGGYARAVQDVLGTNSLSSEYVVTTNVSFKCNWT